MRPSHIQDVGDLVRHAVVSRNFAVLVVGGHRNDRVEVVNTALGKTPYTWTDLCTASLPDLQYAIDHSKAGQFLVLDHIDRCRGRASMLHRALMYAQIGENWLIATAERFPIPVTPGVPPLPVDTMNPKWWGDIKHTRVIQIDDDLAVSVAPRRFRNKDSWDDDDSFDGVEAGLMDMPSFRRPR